MASRRLSSRYQRRDSTAPYPPKEKAAALTVDMPPPPPPTSEEECLGGADGQKYALGDVLGEGAFATVHYATERGTGVRYALKLIDREGTNVAEAKRERSLLEQLGVHKHLVGLVDSFELPSAWALVLELAEGGEVFERICDGGPFSEADAAAVVRQVALGLQHVHGLGVVHRDLKPENLLLVSHAPDAHVKIADFGLASHLDEPVTGAHGEVSGTPAYMAPELFEAHGQPGGALAPAAAALDVWSLGVILFNLLSGYQPFDPQGNAHEAELRRRIVEAEWGFADYPSRWESVSEAARQVVRGMLAPAPSARLSCEGVLATPWVARLGAASATPLPGSEAALRGFNDLAKTWRAAVHAAALVVRCPAAVGCPAATAAAPAAAAAAATAAAAAAPAAAAAAPAKALPQAAVAELRASFDSLDADGSGSLELPELRRLVLSLGVDEAQAARVLACVDTDGDGKLGFGEFCAAVAPMYSASSRQLRAAFDLFDTDGSGFIERAEMAAMLSRLRLPHEQPVGEAESRRLFDAADANHDGKISFAEFLRYFEKPDPPAQP